ncbi:unnamed protein product [Cochlearia groenlandica]
MGCCFSKKNHPDPNKTAIDKPLKPKEKLEFEESKPNNNEVESIQGKVKPRKEVFVIKHRISHERSEKTKDPDESPVSDEKSTGDVDAILIQCGKLSRSNSAAAKTRRFSGSKRSFDFDGIGHDAEEADVEDGGEEEEEIERRIHRNRHRRGEESPRERRRRRTPSRERENRSGIGNSGGGGGCGGGGSRRVSRSPIRRSETNPNTNPNSSAASGNSVNSSNNNKQCKFVSVPATDKSSLVITEKSNNNGDSSINRISVKRNIGKAASPRSQLPARTVAMPSPPSKPSRKTEYSPYKRNPLVKIDTNSIANRNDNIDNDSQKMNSKSASQGPIRRAASPNQRATKEQEKIVEECKVMLSCGIELAKPQFVSRSRSLRKSRDFDFDPEALLSNNNNNNNNPVAAASALPSYTALLLQDIHNFHQKSVNVNATSSSVSKESTKNQQERIEKKTDLMEPSFEKYVTVKRGCSTSLEEMEEEESSGSNGFIASSCVVKQRRQGYLSASSSSSSSWEPNSAESRDRMCVKSNNKELDLCVDQEFDPLKKNGGGIGSKRVALFDSSSDKDVIPTTTTTTSRVVAVTM